MKNIHTDVGGGKELKSKSAIWHKMPFHTQFLIISSEIFTTKKSLKDLHIEGKKIMAPSNITLDLPPL